MDIKFNTMFIAFYTALTVMLVANPARGEQHLDPDKEVICDLGCKAYLIAVEVAAAAEGKSLDKNNKDSDKYYDVSEGEASANLGNTHTMNILGWMYYKGLGVTQNDSQAASWYQKAAYLDNPIGMHNLGIMYEYGRGVPKDLKLAQQWYDKSCGAGGECLSVD